MAPKFLFLSFNSNLPYTEGNVSLMAMVLLTIRTGLWMTNIISFKCIHFRKCKSGLMPGRTVEEHIETTSTASTGYVGLVNWYVSAPKNMSHLASGLVAYISGLTKLALSVHL